MAAWRVLREHIPDQQWPAPISEDEVGASPLHLFIAISAAFLDIFARPGSSKVLDYIRIGLRVPVSSSLERVGGKHGPHLGQEGKRPSMSSLSENGAPRLGSQLESGKGAAVEVLAARSRCRSPREICRLQT
jgi:hypothetical protein